MLLSSRRVAEGILINQRLISSHGSHLWHFNCPLVESTSLSTSLNHQLSLNYHNDFSSHFMEITDLCSLFIIIKDYEDDTIIGHVVIPPCSGSELT